MGNIYRAVCYLLVTDWSISQEIYFIRHKWIANCSGYIAQTVKKQAQTRTYLLCFCSYSVVSWKKYNLRGEIWPQSYAKLQQKDLRAVWVLYNKTLCEEVLQLIWDVNFKKKTCYFLWMFVVAGVSVRVAYSMAKLMFMLFLVSTMLMLITSVYE